MIKYKPKIIEGMVKGTGYPIDGCVMFFSKWDYDNYSSWHLYGWKDEDDKAVMKTFYQTEKEVGFCIYDSLEEFEAAWKSEEWEPVGSFCLELDQVEVRKVLQEEEK